MTASRMCLSIVGSVVKLKGLGNVTLGVTDVQMELGWSPPVLPMQEQVDARTYA